MLTRTANRASSIGRGLCDVLGLFRYVRTSDALNVHIVDSTLLELSSPRVVTHTKCLPSGEYFAVASAESSFGSLNRVISMESLTAKGCFCAMAHIGYGDATKMRRQLMQRARHLGTGSSRGADALETTLRIGTPTLDRTALTVVP